MFNGNRYRVIGIALASIHLFSVAVSGVSAQPVRAKLGPPESVAQSVVQLTLDEAKQRALANNKLLNLASMNAEAKSYAVKAARADYFPKFNATSMYLHFDDPLGSLLSGRKVGVLAAVPSNLAVVNQDSWLTNIGTVQPITDLLKVRQGVKIAQADEQIALAQMRKGMRDLVSGVQQLYWGLLFARRLEVGALDTVRAAELYAQTKTVEARISLVEAQQGLRQVQKQIIELEEQLVGLLDLPLCTKLELVEPARPAIPYRCAEEVIGLALSASPELQEMHHTILKVEAAVAAGKLDYLPSVALVSGYVNQSGASYIQPNFGYVGVVGTYNFVDWGKRRSVLRERQTLGSMARLKSQQIEDEIRQKVQKVFRDLAESESDLKLAQEMVLARKDAEKQASTNAVKDPANFVAAVKARILAEVDSVKSDLSYRQGYVQLMSLITRE